MISFRDTDFISATARVRALENRIIGEKALRRLAQASGPEELFRTLASLGFGGEGLSALTFEEALSRELQAAFDEVERMVGCEQFGRLFRLKYDAHNLKVFLKAGRLPGYPVQKALSPLSRLGAKEMEEELAEGYFQKIYPPMGGAALRAREQLYQTGDPQVVDLILERAWLEGIAQLVREFESPFLRQLITAQIDIANIRIFVRAKRTGRGQEFLRGCLAEDGSIRRGVFLAAANSTFDAFFHALEHREYEAWLAPYFEDITAGRSLSGFEKACDNYLIHLIREAKFTAFGIQPLAAYLLAKEAENKAIRTVVASKLAGIPAQEILGRLRDSYV